MEPALGSGDRVLTFNWGGERTGDVVVFKVEKVVMVKRVEKVERGKFYISGDNKSLSSKIGPINKNQIIGKVIYKY